MQSGLRAGSRWLVLPALMATGALLAQQRNAPVIPRPPLGLGPFIFDTAEQHKIRVVVVTKGLTHPWGLAFLPDGSMLVTERAGQLRVIRDGVLDPKPIPGARRLRGLRSGGMATCI
jgi:glucose/arabinose dehydrogenase